MHSEVCESAIVPAGRGRHQSLAVLFVHDRQVLETCPLTINLLTSRQPMLLIHSKMH
jgi:hypothetical protein